tara:strand:- start:207 stop:383 length:177 start_codon:yes stop_codon:yes gene_type:complete
LEVEEQVNQHLVLLLVHLELLVLLLLLHQLGEDLLNALVDQVEEEIVVNHQKLVIHLQ